MNADDLLKQSQDAVWGELRNLWGEEFSPGTRFSVLSEWIQAPSFEDGEDVLRRAHRFRPRFGRRAAYDFDMTPEALAFAKSNKHAVLLPLLLRSVEIQIEDERDRHAKAIEEWRARHGKTLANHQKLRRRLKKYSRKRRTAFTGRRLLNWMYLVVLSATVIVVGVLVWYGITQKPNVSIEFNVGEIIAGLLAGTGALVAGGAYALKTIRGTTPPGER